MATDSVKRQKKESSVSQLLIYGFLREIEQTLNNQIIPRSINVICLKFYYLPNLLFGIRCVPNVIYIADIHAAEEKLIHSHKLPKLDLGSIYISGCCSTSELKIFPKDVIDTFNPYSTTALFKCGGWSSSSCCGILINKNNFSQIYNWHLPQISNSIYGNSITFSSVHQLLISIGGQLRHGNQVSGLYFHEKDNNNWSWNSITQLPQNRYNSSCIFMNKYNKLFVAGGKEASDNLNTAILYDIDEKKWKDLATANVGRRAAGIYYNEWKEEIYFGGGIDSSDNGKSVEWYDFVKDKWNLIKIPDTKFAHKVHPTLWMENNILLYIASISNDRGPTFGKSSNSIEFIDLRVCDKWNFVIDDNLLCDVFNIKGYVSCDNVCLLTN